MNRSLELIEKSFILKGSGYKYADTDGCAMVKYHVGSCSIFQDEINKDTEFGGRLSVRKPENMKPLIIWGHDECIFKQYLLTNKSLYAPDGEAVLVTKYEGQ